MLFVSHLYLHLIVESSPSFCGQEILHHSSHRFQPFFCFCPKVDLPGRRTSVHHSPLSNKPGYRGEPGARLVEAEGFNRKGVASYPGECKIKPTPKKHVKNSQIELPKKEAKKTYKPACF